MVEQYLNNRLITLYIVPFVLGSLTVFSFQPFNFTIINFIVLPVFLYLIIYIKKKSRGIYRKKPYKKNLFVFGTVFGFGFYLSGTHWITHSLTFDESFKFLIPIGLILIPLFLSLFFSIVVVLIGPLLNLNFRSILLLSGSLAFSDFLRSKILTGFPWNLWSYSFSWSTEILQILNILGLFCFNLIVITLFMLPGLLFFNLGKSIKFFSLVSIGLIFMILYIYGNHSINKNQLFIKTTKSKFNIKIVSPNFELKYGLSFDQIDKRLKKIIKYSDPSNDSKTLYVWPEGVFSGYSYNELASLSSTFSKNFKENHFILLGINKLDQEKKAFYNSLIIVNNRFEIIGEYKKQKLVPFGEFLPMEKILNKFGLKKITEGYGSFLKGENQENLLIEKLNILPLICYEVIFTNLIQKSNKNTNLIINISEDGWFGNSIGPYQHFSKAIFRAIEHNIFLLRSANKGISAIVNNKGQVVKKLDSNESGNIELEVPIFSSENKNKNDLIFFALLITYIFIFIFTKKSNGK